MTTLIDDIAKITEQEQRLVLPRFDANDAWELGCALRSLVEARGAAVTIEIRIAKETVFFVAMPGTTPGNADWARRKRNSTELLHKSSYRIGRELERDDASLEAKLGLATRDHASHGGSYPLRVQGVGVVGTVTVSGLPQRDDHAVIVETLAARCGVPLAEIALGS